MAPLRRRAYRTLAFVLLIVGAVTAPAGAAAGPTLAHSASASISRVHTFPAPRHVTHVAVHWRGARGARVRVALSRDGRRFARARGPRSHRPPAAPADGALARRPRTAVAVARADGVGRLFAAEGDPPDRLGRGRVLSVRLERTGDLATRVLSRPEADRASHGDAEQRP